MSDILTRIETYKRAEIAAAKRARPPATVEAEARAAPPPRGFPAPLRPPPPAGPRALVGPAPRRRRLCADRRDQEGEPLEGPDPRRFRPRRAGARLRGGRGDPPVGAYPH